MYNDYHLIVFLKEKPSEPLSPEIDQSGNRGRYEKMRLRRMLPAYFGVATGT
jgi:hypothetical protein